MIKPVRLFLVYLYVCLCQVHCIPVQEFYEFGTDTTEESVVLKNGDNVTSSSLSQEKLFIFYDMPQPELIVSTVLFCSTVI